MQESARAQATGLLETADTAIPGHLERLFPLVYDELRVLAHRQLGGERPDHTLRTTALVHEAYVRLVDDTRVSQKGRVANISLGNANIAIDRFAHELIDLDRALDELAKLNPRHARVIECRFFGGLDVDESAEALGVSARTVKYDWALARAWLHGALGGEAGG